MFKIEIIYENGRSITARDSVADLASAAHVAIQLADDIGSASMIDDDNLAIWVNIRASDRLEIGIAVVRGGLLSDSV